MTISGYSLTVCTVVSVTLCSAGDAFSQPAQTGAGDAQESRRQLTASREVVEIDLSERGDVSFDVSLKKDLAKVRLRTQPIILDLTWSKVGGDLLKNLRGLKYLKGLCLFGTDVSDCELQHLGELPSLESLDLGACHVTIEGILHLRSSRRLKRLGLADVRPPIDDNAIERIASAWPNLESISLSSSQITDAGLFHVGNLRRLRYLNVSRTQITDMGLKSLADLSQLTTLHVHNTKITDQGMVPLGRMTSLEKLVLSHTGISDRGLREVCGLTSLKRIYFVGTKVTDDGLEHLKPLKTIEFVGPSKNISSGALEGLKDSLPLFKKNKRG